MRPGLYSEYVDLQQQRNPCLQNLCQFMKEERNNHPCRVLCVDFSDENQTRKQRYFDTDALAGFLEATFKESKLPRNDDSPEGSMLIVEDLNKPIIELLGSYLDIGLILVDPPTKAEFQSPEKKMSLKTELFQGGYEDFLAPGSLAENEKIELGRKSTLEDILFYFNQGLPPSFNKTTPSLLSLGYYPLRIVAGEWVRYLEVLNLTSRNYEYTTEIPAEDLTLLKLDTDMSLLQLWGRRCMQTVSKLNYVSTFVTHRVAKSSEEEKAVFGAIVQDYQYLEKMVSTYHKQLEAKMQVVTSLIQIVDARRSLKEAANVTRLTNLALLFIPMSFVTSLFGMNDGLSSRQLILFASVSIPMCLGVLLVARFPETKWNKFVAKTKKEKKDSKISV